MAHPYHHAVRSTKLFGGEPEDYLAIHSWFDESKAFMPDVRHRALRHHSEGIFLCESIFGVVLENSAGRKVPVRSIAEQHVQDDLGWIPTVKDWLEPLPLQAWMSRTPFRPAREEREALEKSRAVPTESEDFTGDNPTHSHSTTIEDRTRRLPD